MSKKIPVVEIFGPTIQGEGAVIGQQTFFIRLGLCDFKCTKCDSMHAVDPVIVKKIAAYLTADEIFDALNAHMINKNATHIKEVSLSGGNPAIHADLQPFFDMCAVRKIKVTLETQGTKWQPWIRECSLVTVSPKTPGMGAPFDPDVFTAFIQQLIANEVAFTVKIVVFNALDIEFAASIFDILRTMNIDLTNKLYLSLGNYFPPTYYIDEETNSVQEGSIKNKLIIESMLDRYRALSFDIMSHPRLGDVRFLPQLHVLAYGNTQGY